MVKDMLVMVKDRKLPFLFLFKYILSKNVATMTVINVLYTQISWLSP